MLVRNQSVQNCALLVSIAHPVCFYFIQLFMPSLSDFFDPKAENTGSAQSATVHVSLYIHQTADSSAALLTLLGWKAVHHFFHSATVVLKQ